MVLSKKYSELTAEIYEDRDRMGAASAGKAAKIIGETLLTKDFINVIFAAAPSQNEFLAALVRHPGVDWSRIRAFHMDEYLGLPFDAPQGFGNFLREHLFSLVPFHSVHFIDGQAADPREECRRYSLLLKEFPPDLVCMGIGENGHIAFNDPGEARFDDPDPVRIVNLDTACRIQQVNDGCFSSLEQVPRKALTLTIPALTSGKNIVCVVPGVRKAPAVKAALLGPLDTSCPASILRSHRGAFLYMDRDSSSLIGSD